MKLLFHAKATKSKDYLINNYNLVLENHMHGIVTLYLTNKAALTISSSGTREECRGTRSRVFLPTFLILLLCSNRSLRATEQVIGKVSLFVL